MQIPGLIFLFIATLILAGCSSGKTKQKAATPPTHNPLDQNTITEKYWKLVTLQGKKVTMTTNQEREIHFMLKNEQSQVRGFAGCNTFNGTYTLENGQRIRFSPLAATRKACPGVDVNESEFLRVFELADNYSINADTLRLNVGRRAPLAVFEAVYF